jgi:GNAT superfamily N-acetyltransferase
MNVRRANTGDAAALVPLVAQYWQFEGFNACQPAAIRAPLERLLSSPALGTVLVAAEARQLLGYLTLVFVFSLEHRGMTAEIDEFFVVPDHRACGVGSQLLREAEMESLRQGCTNVSLQISRSNQRGREFYRRHGYSQRPEFDLLEKALGAA